MEVSRRRERKRERKNIDRRTEDMVGCVTETVFAGALTLIDDMSCKQSTIKFSLSSLFVPCFVASRACSEPSSSVVTGTIGTAGGSGDVGRGNCVPVAAAAPAVAAAAAAAVTAAAMATWLGCWWVPTPPPPPWP